ncbi:MULTISPECIES: MFS transporter [unclassified Streptomyces]|uniref:MFS transporter n=1 Tax=unclassified Streptomyces TaxID=2593676 RepID=UPI0001C1B5E9|nr:MULTISPECIES: MFS transporter [unclassified Streptomyces]AEN08511.1 major facilitator superfamily MFS_1 [Streptomyces sp. SirexAA-E]MYR69442.1 MFS transporter [Streptomyces sp. SID4939]MYS01201.1 MFS transporter [Streptomyces sp. SID4940]MYT66344.1 MFS transporter [Streptomyces sp. SID8357]MYT83264.1 MFS transporter [Streptomyces sp. SID8360]
MTTDTVSDGVPAPQAPSRPWALALTAIVGAEFMLQLDGTIVNVALPTLQDDLGVSATSGSWVPNAFLLAFGGLLLFAGRLGDVLGHRKVFLGGIGLVVIASLVAGLAPDLEVLLVGRVLQGAGAAIAGPTGLALLAVVFDGERRRRAFGLYSTVTGLGASAGMVLGGVLTWAGDWRWSLLVNVPVGLVVILIGLRVLGLKDDSTQTRSLGLPSALLVTLAVTAGVYGLVHAAEKGWGDGTTLGALAASVVLWAVLLVVDRRTAEPLLPGKIFTDRTRAGAFLDLLLLAAVLTSFLIYLVQYLQNVLGFNALGSGLAILPFGVALLLTTQVLTRFVAAVDLKIRAVGGLVVVLAGVGWLTLLDGDSSYASGVLPQIVLIGIGVGVAIIPFNMVILTTAPPEHAGVTAGILQTALTIGGSVGLAVLLVPFTDGAGAADTISQVFVWASLITALAILTALVFFFGPGARKKESPAAAE